MNQALLFGANVQHYNLFRGKGLGAVSVHSKKKKKIVFLKMFVGLNSTRKVNLIALILTILVYV